MNNFLDTLNAPQKDAASHIDGALLVLAGAGTGKTRVLTSRLANILMQGAARPHEILAVTFTNKASREMVERVEQLIGGAVAGMWIGTFHSLAVRILRRNPEMVGLRPNFTILDTDDQLRICKELLKEFHIDDKRWPARQLVNTISTFKDNAWRPQDVPADEGWFADNKAIQLYELYQKRLEALNAADFGDLLLKCLVLFKENTDMLERYQEQFKYVLVDEYQDTNTVQYLWLRLLAMPRNNICVVGDDDQSIYAWRGAQVGNILRFEKDFPGAHVVRLEQNYRSTANILAAASGVISNNSERHEKTLWTDGETGEKVKIHSVRDDWEEARLITDTIGDNIRKGGSYEDHAILVRTAAQTRSFEEQMLKEAMPYQVIGGLRFYERKEIRDAVAYLRVVYSSNDSLAFERIVNIPKRGVGDSAMRDLREVAQNRGLSMLDATKMAVDQNLVATRVRTKLAEFCEKTVEWKQKLEDETPDRFMEFLLEDCGYMEMLRTDKNKEEARGRIDNLKELVRALQEYSDVESFLDHVSLVMDREESTVDTVKIMTVHGAKGLEFKNVFLPGFEEGLFPHQRSLDEEGEKGVEEERRLAYVAMTRARENLMITYTASRRMYGQWQPSVASRFLTEIPAQCVEEVTSMSPSFGGSTSYGSAYGGFRAQPGSRMDRYNKPKTNEPMLYEENDYVSDMPQDEEYLLGMRVFHQKFGYGRIKGVEDIGSDKKVTIRFDKAGEKKLLASLANLQPA